MQEQEASGEPILVYEEPTKRRNFLGSAVTIPTIVI
jgi:hypothetical protein